jgi:hypothetical protein
MLTEQEKVLAQEDCSRTEICALFFVKLGFPYVSILQGGFASAHSWLYREKLFSLQKVLVDYEPHDSLWAKLEQAHENPFALLDISRQVSDLVGSGITMGRRGLSATKQSIIDNNKVNVNEARQKLTQQTKQLQGSAKNFFGGMQHRLDKFNQHLAESNGIGMPPGGGNTKGLPPRPVLGIGGGSGSGGGIKQPPHQNPQQQTQAPDSPTRQAPTTTAGAAGGDQKRVANANPTANPWAHLKIAFHNRDPPSKLAPPSKGEATIPAVSGDGDGDAAANETATVSTTGNNAPTLETLERLFQNPFALGSKDDDDDKKKKEEEEETIELFGIGGLSDDDEDEFDFEFE